MPGDSRGEFHEGQRVLAQQLGYRFWHSGTVDYVIRSAPQTFIKVRFDDGSLAQHTPSQVKPIDWREGAAIQCQWPRPNDWQDATIAEFEPDRFKLKARFSDGQVRSISTFNCRSE